MIQWKEHFMCSEGGTMRNHAKRAFSLILLLCLLLSLGIAAAPRASAEDAVITKILTTISATPVALMDPSLITAATSTPGCYIASAGWFDASGNAAVGAFNAETYRLEIRVAANAGYTIASDAACYLNNSAVTAIPDGTGKTVTLVREYTAAIWAPTIYKHPGSETVNEGEWASFVVSGTYIRDYQWMLVNPTDTETVPISSLKSRFPSMDSSGDGSSKLFLYHIPYELNGWKVICNFVGAGNNNNVRSQGAILTVIPDPGRVVETPAPVLEEPPDADVADEQPQSEETDPGPQSTETTPEPEIHEHSYSSVWSYDDVLHWHECPEDSARSDEEAHSFVWTETRAATTRSPGEEKGVCSVCGYQATQEIPVLDQVSSSFLMKALLALIPIDFLLVILHPALFGKQRRKAQKRR